MEEVFVAYMKFKQKSPIGKTELNKAELIREYLSHDKSVLDIKTDQDGNSEVTKYNKENEDENKTDMV